MEEKKTIKISLSTFFLTLAIIALVILGYFTYRLFNYKNNADIQISDLTNQISNYKSSIDSSSNTVNTTNNTENDNTINNIDDEQKKYYNNLSDSLSKNLKEGNTIYVSIPTYKGHLSINNKKEAYIYLPNFEQYSANSGKKIASNVVNAWFCEEGQAQGNEYILFLKDDGTVTYVKFSTDFSSSASTKTKFEDTEKVIKGLTDISDIVTVSGGDEDENGINGLGVLMIKSDGTCMPYSKLEELVNK